MDSMARQHDIGKFFHAKASGAGTAVAAGAGDNTEVDGAYVDRTNRNSVALVITYKATLTEAKKVTFIANLQDATDAAGAGVADFGAALAATDSPLGPSGGGVVEGAIVHTVDLGAARAFIRAQVKPDLNATATDTLTWSAALIFPSDREPAV